MERTALITGASGGIGRAVAEALAPDHHVYLSGRDRDRLQELAAGLPSATALPGDLATDAGLGRVTDALTGAGGAARGGLDVLVHSAGVLHMGTLEELTPAQWRESLEVNVLAPVNLTRALLPALRRARGHVFLVNSGLGHRSMAGAGAYSGSKFALRAFADALRQEESPRGVRVTSIHPGRVATGMQERLHAWEGRDYAAERWVRPEQIADVVLAAVRLGGHAVMDSVDVNPH